jgi:hypothetical protein
MSIGVSRRSESRLAAVTTRSGKGTDATSADAAIAGFAAPAANAQTPAATFSDAATVELPARAPCMLKLKPPCWTRLFPMIAAGAVNRCISLYIGVYYRMKSGQEVRLIRSMTSMLMRSESVLAIDRGALSIDHFP